MTPAKRFEDVIAWQKARALAGAIYRATAKGSFAKDFGLRDQIQRASVSVMANIAEGFERRQAGEYAHFLNIAKASCAEVQSHLYLAGDIGHVDHAACNELLAQAQEVSRIVGALRAAVVAARNAKP